MKTAVIGAGVIGLTTAIRLLEAGHSVTIFAREITPNTTSDVAGAFWHGYLTQMSEELIQLASVTYSEYSKLLAVRESGVQRRQLVYYSKSILGDVWLSSCVEDFKPLASAQIVPPFVDGYEFGTFLIDTSRAVPFLLQSFLAAGGETISADIAAFSEVPNEFAAIFNCTGVYAGKLVADLDLKPVRGQIVRIRKHEALPEKIIDTDRTYVAVRIDDCILGTTATEGEWSLEPDLEATRGIVERCRLLCPEIGEPEILGVGVGLRPVRSSVRIEKESLPDGRTLIHNYGHGGAGYTLCWGSASKAVSLL